MEEVSFNPVLLFRRTLSELRARGLVLEMPSTVCVKICVFRSLGKRRMMSWLNTGQNNGFYRRNAMDGALYHLGCDFVFTKIAEEGCCVFLRLRDSLYRCSEIDSSVGARFAGRKRSVLPVCPVSVCMLVSTVMDLTAHLRPSDMALDIV